MRVGSKISGKMSKFVKSNLSYKELLYEMNYNMNHTERLKLQHPFGKVLIECSFNAEKCGANDFQYELDPNLGSCYSFNSGMNASGHAQPLKKSSRAGTGYGLKIAVYVKSFDLLQKYNDYIGSVIKIGNSSYKLANVGPEIAPGYKTNIMIARSFEEILPKPYSECELPTDELEQHIWVS